MHQVYVYGMISPSTVYVLDNEFSYPEANAYAEVAAIHPSVGGEAANSGIILAKCGVRTVLDGVWLAASRAPQIRALLAPYGIDLSLLTVKEGPFGTNEIVIADRTTRTPFGNYATFFKGQKQWNPPSEEHIRSASLVVLDPYFKDESEKIARLCVKYGTPYVTHDAPADGYIGQHAAANIVSHELRERPEYQGRELSQMFAEFLSRARGLVIFTFGEKELWYGRPGGTLTTFQPYAITPVDTAGAGDSFRGGVAYGLLQGWNDEAVVDFASAVAATVCLSAPHALNAPDLAGIRQFMRDHTRV
ncbi:MAG TPA: hypothetical protein ENN69_07940 [Spirochaetia bacterium]|nr:hypothetical protein [Spirochaetia bacterium]